MYRLTIVQPHHFDRLTSTKDAAECDVFAFIHAAVFQGLYECGRFKLFAGGEVKMAWIRRRVVKGGEESSRRQ